MSCCAMRRREAPGPLRPCPTASARSGQAGEAETSRFRRSSGLYWSVKNRGSRAGNTCCKHIFAPRIFIRFILEKNRQ